MNKKSKELMYKYIIIDGVSRRLWEHAEVYKLDLDNFISLYFEGYRGIKLIQTTKNLREGK